MLAAGTVDIVRVLREYGRLASSGPAMIVCRTDHPHVDGDYLYAIRPEEKRLWTAGERVLSADEIADLWYAVDCPPWR